MNNIDDACAEANPQGNNSQLAPIITPGELSIYSETGRNALSVEMPFSSPIKIFQRIRITGARNDTCTAEFNHEIQIGDKVDLKCHQGNTADKWAVEILYKKDRLGWVCADANEVVFRLLEGGKTLSAEIVDEDYLGSGQVYLIDIFLQD